MKTDVNNCSTCINGQESFEDFYSSINRSMLIQYDYRHTDGVLFSCVAKDLQAARYKRDKWLADHK